MNNNDIEEIAEWQKKWNEFHARWSSGSQVLDDTYHDELDTLRDEAADILNNIDVVAIQIGGK